MLVRFLLVALIVAGQFPLRVCTCGAHDHPPTPTEPTDPQSDHAPASLTADPAFPEHDPDCPMSKPARPCMKPGPVPHAEAAPPPAAVSVPLIPIACPAVLAVFAEPPPVRPPVPLFLSLLVLLI
jgi:hypothetical protein